MVRKVEEVRREDWIDLFDEEEEEEKEAVVVGWDWVDFLVWEEREG